MNITRPCFNFHPSLAFLLALTVQIAYGQAPEIKWFPQVKTAKDQHTLMLLNASETGFHLLRWQDKRTDADGNQTPALPLLTMLSPGGERLHDDPLPGFEDGALDFRFCMANDREALVVYEAPNSAGTQSLFARRLNLASRKWSADPQVLFTDVSNRAPAFANAWFSRSADGRRSCVYRMYGGQTPRIAIALFDEDFQLLWQRTVDLPPTSGQMTMRQLLCAGSGTVLLHCQIFNPGTRTQGQPYVAAPFIYNADGRAFYQNSEWAVEASPYSDAIFLLEPEQGAFADFYPKLGKKFTPAFDISEGPDGLFYCAGFYSDESNDAAEGYFIYSINPKEKQGTLLKVASLPSALRKAYLSKKAAAKKEAVEGLQLRWLRWTTDGRPWILAERQNTDISPGRMEEVTLLRLDSTFRVNSTRKVEKFQRIQTGNPQNFASVAAIPDSKNGWSLLWNHGNWPNAKIMLTECGTRGVPAESILDSSSQSNVSLLPQTLLKHGDTWYFVGESEYHERIRIGRLK